MVDVVNDGRQIVARGSGDDDLARAGVDMRLRLCLGGIEAGALEHDVYAELAPGQIRGVGHLVDDDLLAVDDDVVILALALVEVHGMTLSDPVALRGVILQKMCEHLCGGQIVDRDDVITLCMEHLTESQTADTAKTVDSNFYGHSFIPFFSAFAVLNELNAESPAPPYSPTPYYNTTKADLQPFERVYAITFGRVCRG